MLGDGGKLRSTCIATHLGCSLKTVKRELETLRLAGKIEFIGPNKTGTYQLVGKSLGNSDNLDELNRLRHEL